jgi:type I restriction enzyme, S subunit
VSSGWRTLPFDDAIRDISAGNPKLQTGEYLSVGRYPIVDQGQNLIAGYCDDQSALTQITGPVIIFGDHTRVIKYVDFPFCVGADGVKILKPTDDINAKYAFHFLSRSELPSAGYSRHFKYLKRTKFLFPPIDEQRRIAAILDQADVLRRKRREALERLKLLPSAVLDELLGNENAGTVLRLDELIQRDDRINYGVVQPGPDVEQGVPLVRVENVVDEDLSRSSLKHISPQIEAQYRRSRLRGDEILIACVGSIGAVALAQPDQRGFNIARAVARIPVDSMKAERVFIAEHLRTPKTQAYFKSETRAVAQPTLNIKQLCETRLSVPPLAVQRAFAARIAEVDRIKGHHRAHLAKLDALFASLQYRAFRGKL